MASPANYADRLRAFLAGATAEEITDYLVNLGTHGCEAHRVVLPEDALACPPLREMLDAEEMEAHAAAFDEEHGADIEVIMRADDPNYPPARETLDNLISHLAANPGLTAGDWFDQAGSFDDSAGYEALRMEAMHRFDTAMGLVRENLSGFLKENPAADEKAWAVQAIENRVDPRLVQIACADRRESLRDPLA